MKNVTSNTINQKKNGERKEPRNHKRRPLQIPPPPRPPLIPAKPSTAPQKLAPPPPPPLPKGMRAGLAKRPVTGSGAIEAGKTQATPPAAGETNQWQRRRTSGGGSELEARVMNQRWGRRRNDAVMEE
ncbi:hypothetical protein ACOSQ2_031528 [Xanthoceras sorbifolium]